MSSNPVSFRFPLNVEGKAHADVVEAIQYHDDAITDLQSAIPSLKSQIAAISKTAAGTATQVNNITNASETTVINPATLPQGGPTSGRPTTPVLYQSYLDTTLGQPVYWNGSVWINAAGVSV